MVEHCQLLLVGLRATRLATIGSYRHSHCGRRQAQLRNFADGHAGVLVSPAHSMITVEGITRELRPRTLRIAGPADVIARSRKNLAARLTRTRPVTPAWSSVLLASAAVPQRRLVEREPVSLCGELTESPNARKNSA